MIDLDQLSAFVTIAERGTVTSAARKLHRTQSAISRRLSLLEDALGAQLFDRRGAALALTDAGRAFLPFAESALAAVASGRDAVKQQQAPGAGSVSIAIVGTLVEAPLAQALRELPSLALSVLTASSAEVSRLVRCGEANLGLRYFEDADGDLTSELLGLENLCVVASPAATPATTQRWIGFPFTRSFKEDFGRLLEQQLTAAGMRGAEVMAVDSLSAQKRLVEVGLGLALLPESSVREELARGTLVVVDMPSMATTIPIHLVQRRVGYKSPAAGELIAVLKQVFAAQSGSQRKRRPGRGDR